MGDLYVLGRPDVPAKFVKVLGAGPNRLLLRPYSEPPNLRWWLEPGVPTLIIEPQATDREIHILEVTQAGFRRWAPIFCATAGLNPEEATARNQAVLAKIPRIADNLFRQLTAVEPSRDGSLEYRPCRVRLTDSQVIDRVYVVHAEQYIDLWGIWPEFDQDNQSVSIEDVEIIEESPVRIPARLASKMYAAGESTMGGCFFTLVLSDGRRLRCETRNAVDFVALPPNIQPDMIVDLLPHKGRYASRHISGADFYWCLYRPPI